MDVPRPTDLLNHLRASLVSVVNPPTRTAIWLNRPWLGPALFGCLAAGLVLARLDPTGDHPGTGTGPGLTVDESFNVAQGVQLFDRLMAGDLTGFRQVDAALPDHPPLGRLWIGLCHEVAFLAWPPVGTQSPAPGEPPAAYSITCARVGPALAFAMTVVLVGWATGRWFGGLAGCLASLSLILMPRSFGHAHLASLETCVNLAYAAVVLYLADRWGTPAPRTNADQPSTCSSPSLAAAAFAGVLLGLALLTKIQAVLLPVPIAIWALCVMRWRGVGLLAVWGLVGLGVMFVGWPWLWESPWSHLMQYLGRTTDRATIYVWYLGKVIADREVPWHYPWVMWLTTVPVGLHLLGACGLWQALRAPESRSRAALIGGCLVFPLLVFSIPGIAVYDGERLFSVSYPLWAVLIGRGAAWLIDRTGSKSTRTITALAAACLFATQSYGLFAMSPCWLSYYNLAVGGASGAERLGLPVTYWGDGVTRKLLADAADLVGPNGRLAVAPVLHEAQWEELRRQCPALLERNIRLIPLAPNAEPFEFVLLFPRKEYLPEEYRILDEPVLFVQRGGATLAGVYRRRSGGR